MAIKLTTWNRPRMPTERELKDQLIKECLKPVTYVMEPNEKQDTHEHLYKEIALVLKGSVEYCAEGRCLALKPGDRVEISKKTPHTAKSLVREQTVLLTAQR